MPPGILSTVFLHGEEVSQAGLKWAFCLNPGNREDCRCMPLQLVLTHCSLYFLPPLWWQIQPCILPVFYRPRLWHQKVLISTAEVTKNPIKSTNWPEVSTYKVKVCAVTLWWQGSCFLGGKKILGLAGQVTGARSLASLCICQHVLLTYSFLSYSFGDKLLHSEVLCATLQFMPFRKQCLLPKTSVLCAIRILPILLTPEP